MLLFLRSYQRGQHGPTGAADDRLHQGDLIPRLGNRPAELLADEVHLGSPADVRDGFPGGPAVGGLLDLGRQRPACIGREEIQSFTGVGRRSPGIAAIPGGKDVIEVGDLGARVVLAVYRQVPEVIAKKEGVVRAAGDLRFIAKNTGVIRRFGECHLLPGGAGIAGLEQQRTRLDAAAVAGQPSVGGVGEQHGVLGAGLDAASFLAVRVDDAGPGSSSVGAAVDHGVIVHHPHAYVHPQPPVLAVDELQLAGDVDLRKPADIQGLASRPGNASVRRAPHDGLVWHGCTAADRVSHPDVEGILEIGCGSFLCIGSGSGLRRGDVFPGGPAIDGEQDMVTLNHSKPADRPAGVCVEHVDGGDGELLPGGEVLDGI